MNGLLTALRRRLRWPRRHPAGVLLCDAPGNEDNWTFTLSDESSRGPGVEALTFNGERANDPRWLALFCRAHSIRFAAETNSGPPSGQGPEARPEGSADGEDFS